MKKFIFILLILNLVYAANNAGSFLDNHITARTVGLGNAFSAVTDSPEVVFFNPAGIALHKNREVSITSNDIWGVNTIIAVSSFELYGERVGFSLLRSSEDDIKEAKLDGLGNPYFTNNTFSWSGEALYFSWAKTLSRKDHLGISLKVINEQLYEKQAHGIGFDVGYLCQLNKSTNLALVFENVNRPELVWNTENLSKERVPQTVRIGLINIPKKDKLLLSLELTRKDDREPLLHGGAEYWLIKREDLSFAVRGGLEPKAFSVGTTVKLENIRFEYAFRNSEYRELDQVHLISFGYIFDNNKQEIDLDEVVSHEL